MEAENYFDEGSRINLPAKTARCVFFYRRDSYRKTNITHHQGRHHFSNLQKVACSSSLFGDHFWVIESMLRYRISHEFSLEVAMLFSFEIHSTFCPTRKQPKITCNLERYFIYFATSLIFYSYSLFPSSPRRPELRFTFTLLHIATKPSPYRKVIH